MRGEQCMYDHGPDPVVMDDSALQKMVKLPPTKAPALNFRQVCFVLLRIVVFTNYLIEFIQSYYM